MHQNCPVCQENLFNSTSECRVLRCGHTMHRDCLRALVGRAQLARCPLCAVSITESAAIWAQMDSDIARSVMPEEYRDVTVRLLFRCHDSRASPGKKAVLESFEALFHVFEALMHAFSRARTSLPVPLFSPPTQPLRFFSLFSGSHPCRMRAPSPSDTHPSGHAPPGTPKH